MVGGKSRGPRPRSILLFRPRTVGSSLSWGLVSCCFVDSQSAFHCKIRGVCLYRCYSGSETKRLVRGWVGVGAAGARQQGHVQWPVLVTLLATSREIPDALTPRSPSPVTDVTVPNSRRPWKVSGSPSYLGRKPMVDVLISKSRLKQPGPNATGGHPDDLRGPPKT